MKTRTLDQARHILTSETYLVMKIYEGSNADFDPHTVKACYIINADEQDEMMTKFDVFADQFEGTYTAVAKPCPTSKLAAAVVFPFCTDSAAAPVEPEPVVINTPAATPNWEEERQKIYRELHKELVEDFRVEKEKQRQEDRIAELEEENEQLGKPDFRIMQVAQQLKEVFMGNAQELNVGVDHVINAPAQDTLTPEQCQMLDHAVDIFLTNLGYDKFVNIAAKIEADPSIATTIKTML